MTPWDIQLSARQAAAFITISGILLGIGVALILAYAIRAKDR